MANVILSFCLLLSACKGTDDEPGLLNGPWVENAQGRVTLYTRPLNYSSSSSPDKTAIRATLQNQNKFIETINQRLHVNYRGAVAIYFFNLDEAKAKLGTSAGGSSNFVRKEIYYSFYLSQYYPNYNLSDYLGIHEMVHIISCNMLGTPGSLMMAEGYAVAVDGTLGSSDNTGKTRKSISAWMDEFKNKSTLHSPSILLDNFSSLPEAEAYAQSGYFVNWLFDQYGVDKINHLFPTKAENFKAEFEKITGDSFANMETAYLNEVR